MWLDLEIKRQYRFDDILDPVRFFERLSLILDPLDTLVLGCYEAREDIREFLTAHALPPPTEVRYRFQRGFDIHRDSYPNGAAFHLRSDSATVEQLSQFARSVAGAEELCDHLAAYNSQWPLFIFHDAFCSDPFFVSSRVGRDRVEAFARSIEVPFAEIDFECTM